MIVELILSFLVIAFIYALDEVFLIEEVWKKMFTIYGNWQTHFRINPLKAGIPFALLTHSILVGIIAYFCFGVVEDFFYQLIRRIRGLNPNWDEYVLTFAGVPRYYFIYLGVSVILAVIYFAVLKV